MNLKVLKKVIKIETFNVDFHNKFIKYGLFCFFFPSFIYTDLYIKLSPVDHKVWELNSLANRRTV